MTQSTALTTTGLEPMTIGSPRTFEWSADLNGLPWNILGGTATLILQDPTGAQTTIAGVIDPTGFAARANWNVTGPIGDWTLCWAIQDPTMTVPDRSQPVTFAVISSP